MTGKHFLIWLLFVLPVLLGAPPAVLAEDPSCSDPNGGSCGVQVDGPVIEVPPLPPGDDPPPKPGGGSGGQGDGPVDIGSFGWYWECKMWTNDVCRVLVSDEDPNRLTVSYGPRWLHRYMWNGIPVTTIPLNGVDSCCAEPAAPTPTPMPTPLPDWICEENPIWVNPGRGWVSVVLKDKCLLGFDLEAYTSVPPVEVYYSPAPRSMVNMDTLFTADAAHQVTDWVMSPGVDYFDPSRWIRVDSEEYATGPGCPPSHETRSPSYRNFRIGVRLERVNPEDDYFPQLGTVPCWVLWDFDEREWAGPQRGCGELTDQGVMAEHLYMSSSAGKPANGMGLDGVANLPAYQVQAVTYWAVHWRMEWEHLECVQPGKCDYTCCKKHTTGSDGEESCAQYGTCQADKCYQLDWVLHEREGLCDLTQYGHPTWYLESPNLRTPDGREGTVLPVPVIEVQGLIEQAED